MENDQFINIEVDINRKMDVDIHISDIMYAINNSPLQRKWNIVAGILGGMNLKKVDEDGDAISKEDILTPEQVKLVQSFLLKQLDVLETY